MDPSLGPTWWPIETLNLLVERPKVNGVDILPLYYAEMEHPHYLPDLH